jgi:hypothetical protein
MDNFTMRNTKMLICGKTGSGKSQLLRYILMKNKSHFKKIFLISPTEKINSFYSKIIPKENIFDEFKEDWLNNLFIKLTEINANVKDDKACHVLLIFDDCCSDTDFRHSKAICKEFTRGRHIFIACVITAQYIYQVPPVLRTNADYILVGQMNRQGVDLLTQEYQMGNITPKEFTEMYYRCTSNHQFLIINNNSVTDNNNLNDIYGTIKTPPEYLK